jgi:uncharacterized membrane protein YhaH (DUF805 family)
MAESDLDNNYAGVDRLQYFLGNIGIIVAAIAAVSIFGPRSTMMTIVSIGLTIASLALDVMRLQNVGLSQWYAFIRFLPFGNTILLLGLLAAQPGWNTTRQLDSAGRSILITELILIGVMIFMAFRFRFFELPLFGFGPSIL